MFALSQLYINLQNKFRHSMTKSCTKMSFRYRCDFYVQIFVGFLQSHPLE